MSDGIGAGKVDQVFIANSKAITLSDITMPCLGLNYSLAGQANESPLVRYDAATIEIDNNGNASKLEITVTIQVVDQEGSAGTDITYTMAVVASGSANTAWQGTSPTFTADAYTLYDAIKLLKLIPGMNARAIHAPYDMILNSDNFIDLAAGTYIYNQPGKYLECLYRDVDQFKIDGDLVTYMRIGLPEPDDSGAFQILDIYGDITGATNDYIRIYRDDIADYVLPTGTYATDMGKKQVLLYRADPDYSAGVFGDNIDDAMTVLGSVIVEIKSDDLTGANVYVKIRQQTV